MCLWENNIPPPPHPNTLCGGYKKFELHGVCKKFVDAGCWHEQSLKDDKVENCKYWDIAVIILKFEQGGFSIQRVQKI